MTNQTVSNLLIFGLLASFLFLLYKSRQPKYNNKTEYYVSDNEFLYRIKDGKVSITLNQPFGFSNSTLNRFDILYILKMKRLYPFQAQRLFPLVFKEKN